MTKKAEAGFPDMNDAEFDELMRLARTYQREARRCEPAKAYLGGCVLLGAYLETSLIAMVYCFAEDVAALPSAPKRKGVLKPVNRWTLSELLGVARQLGWLPANLDPNEKWDKKRAHIGDYAEVLRELRNLLHPGRYLTDHPRKRITQRHLALSFEVLVVATEHMYRKLEDSILADSENEDAAEPTKSGSSPVT